MVCSIDDIVSRRPGKQGLFIFYFLDFHCPLTTFRIIPLTATLAVYLLYLFFSKFLLSINSATICSQRILNIVERGGGEGVCGNALFTRITRFTRMNWHEWYITSCKYYQDRFLSSSKFYWQCTIMQKSGKARFGLCGLLFVFPLSSRVHEPPRHLFSFRFQADELPPEQIAGRSIFSRLVFWGELEI